MDSKEKILSEIDLRTFIETETGCKFDKNNKMCCPLHDEKTASFSVKHYADKDRYYCFGCGRRGDIIDFVKEYKNMNYDDACDYIGIAPNEERKKIMTLMDKVKKSIDNCHFKDSQGNPLKYLRTHIYVDASNNILYFEPRFKDTSNNKTVSRFFSITENNCIVPKRGCDAVPYNQYKLLEGLRNHKNIFIVEGAKDADTLIHFGYLATSFKGVKDFDYSLFRDSIVYIIPDTGETGEKYKDDLYYKLKDYVKEFNVIYPRGLKELGNNKDITDWFQSGKTIADFKAALNDKWDYKKNKTFRYVTNSGSLKKVWGNFERICELNDITIKYNELSKRVEFKGDIFSLLNKNDACFEDLYQLCLDKYFSSITRKDLQSFIFRVSQKNSYNPARDYFEKCYKNWNHQEGYIKQLADTIITPNDYDNEFKELLLRKWLIGIANISFNDGTQNMNGVLVVQGKQGIGKTRWVSTLLPNSNWIDTDKRINPKKVDDVIDVTSALITELGELPSSLKKENINELKMFFTKKKDRYRRPYGMVSEEYPRVTAFYATVNDNEFLEDDTGNRRYWCIRVNSMIVEHNVDINQLWGEVMYLLKDVKERHWLNEDEEKQLYIINSDFEVKTEADTKIADSFNWLAPKEYWVYKTLTSICDDLDLKMNKETRNSLKKLGAIAQCRQLKKIYEK